MAEGDGAGLEHPLVTGALLTRALGEFDQLRDYVQTATVRDPSWGDNTASAVFAADVLRGEEPPDRWRSIARLVRNRWKTDDSGELPTYVHGVPSEAADFDVIHRRMIDEDRAGVLHQAEMQAGRIDMDLFRRTWTVGLLLSLEGEAPDPDPERLGRLRKSAARAMATDGSFYPRRVPWVTARVVLGLAGVGDTVDTSDTVEKACEWLLRARDKGPYDLGVWASGTGTWNSTVETTAMCLSALMHANWPARDERIRTGTAYLLATKAQWRETGHESDAAQAIEAIVRAGLPWQTIAPELDRLLAWYSNREPWTRTTVSASESQEESSKVPWVASSLLSVLRMLSDLAPTRLSE
ncbi:MAG: hypothetical protein ACHQ50_12990 [Fimbriimonadales bacterium]